MIETAIAGTARTDARRAPLGDAHDLAAVALPVVLVAGSSGTTLVRATTTAILRAAGFTVAESRREAVERRLGPRARLVVAAEPGMADGLLAPEVLALTSLRSDELASGVTRTDFASRVRSLLERTRGGVAVNADDPVALGLAALGRAPVSATGGLDPSPIALERDGRIVLCDPHTGARRVIPTSDVPLASPAYLRDVLVGITAAVLAGAGIDAVPRGLAGLPDDVGGLRLLGTRRGIRWYADPKSTRPGRALPALAVDPARTLLIAGGMDGGQPLERWGAAVAGIQYALLYGSAAARFADAAREVTQVVRCADLEDAVASARKLAHRGDLVAFSPGCLPERGSGEEAAARAADLAGLGGALHKAA
jgi:hypothetical protein